MKNVSDRIGGEAREVLEWLDEVTTAHPEHAMLQGGQETYDTWAEVEKHLLPDTLLSAPDDASDELTETLEQTSIGSTTPPSPRSTRSSLNSASVPASPAKTTKSLSSVQSMQAPVPVSMPDAKEQEDAPEDNSTIPKRLQPLLNHLLWRIHKDPHADSDFRSYIFVANNLDARSAAQRFGVRVKTFEQLRDVIKREERDLKNRMSLWNKENEIASSPQAVQSPEKPTGTIIPNPEEEVEPDSDEEVIVMRPRGSPPTPASTPPAKPVLDPNDFGRVARSPQAPTGPGRRRRGGMNGGRGGMHGPRGGSPKMHQPFVGSAQRAPNYPIDPDSYARPPPTGGSLRGGRRKLWTPS